MSAPVLSSITALVVCAIVAAAPTVTADVSRDRASASGYLRIMSRPSLTGGDSRRGM
jgi:hypothetical protein